MPGFYYRESELVHKFGEHPDETYCERSIAQMIQGAVPRPETDAHRIALYERMIRYIMENIRELAVYKVLTPHFILQDVINHIYPHLDGVRDRMFTSDRDGWDPDYVWMMDACCGALRYKTDVVGKKLHVMYGIGFKLEEALAISLYKMLMFVHDGLQDDIQESKYIRIDHLNWSIRDLVSRHFDLFLKKHRDVISNSYYHPNKHGEVKS